MNLTKKVSQLLDKIKKEDKKINSFLYINPKALEQAKHLDAKKKKGKLYGKVIGIKSNINVKDMPISCASKTLENYIGTYDATVIKKIKDEDALIIGMLNMDEFACGSSGETSAFGPTQNPIAPGKIPGGSSSGSAAAVAAGFCDAALGSDTGSSIRLPAAFCGVIGVKPSYGLVSRYGLIDLAMSLDQIGPITKTVDDAALILDIIRGRDDKDTITLESKPIKTKNPGKLKIGVVKLTNINKKVQTLTEKKVEQLKKLGHHVNNIEISHIDLAVQTYFTLVYAEFFSATRRFDGRKYGKKIEDSCGEEVLRRILGGSEITKAEYSGAYYQKALQVKTLVKEEFENALKKFNCLLMPTSPDLPWNIGDYKKMKPEDIYSYDALTIPGNLAEICAVSIPAGTINKIPMGIQIICNKYQDAEMLSIAKEVEKLSKIEL